MKREKFPRGGKRNINDSATSSSLERDHVSGQEAQEKKKSAVASGSLSEVFLIAARGKPEE